MVVERAQIGVSRRRETEECIRLRRSGSASMSHREWQPQSVTRCIDLRLRGMAPRWRAETPVPLCCVSLRMRSWVLLHCILLGTQTTRSYASRNSSSHIHKKKRGISLEGRKRSVKASSLKFGLPKPESQSQLDSPGTLSCSTHLSLWKTPMAIDSSNLVWRTKKAHTSVRSERV